LGRGRKTKAKQQIAEIVLKTKISSPFMDPAPPTDRNYTTSLQATDHGQARLEKGSRNFFIFFSVNPMLLSSELSA